MLPQFKCFKFNYNLLVFVSIEKHQSLQVHTRVYVALCMKQVKSMYETIVLQYVRNDRFHIGLGLIRLLRNLKHFAYWTGYYNNYLDSEIT